MSAATAPQRLCLKAWDPEKEPAGKPQSTSTRTALGLRGQGTLDTWCACCANWKLEAPAPDRNRNTREKARKKEDAKRRENGLPTFKLGLNRRLTET